MKKFIIAAVLIAATLGGAYYAGLGSKWQANFLQIEGGSFAAQSVASNAKIRIFADDFASQQNDTGTIAIKMEIPSKASSIIGDGIQSFRFRVKIDPAKLRIDAVNGGLNGTGYFWMISEMDVSESNAGSGEIAIRGIAGFTGTLLTAGIHTLATIDVTALDVLGYTTVDIKEKDFDSAYSQVKKQENLLFVELVGTGANAEIDVRDGGYIVNASDGVDANALDWSLGSATEIKNGARTVFDFRFLSDSFIYVKFSDTLTVNQVVDAFASGGVTITTADVIDSGNQTEFNVILPANSLSKKVVVTTTVNGSVTDGVVLTVPRGKLGVIASFADMNNDGVVDVNDLNNVFANLYGKISGNGTVTADFSGLTGVRYIEILNSRVLKVAMRTNSHTPADVENLLESVANVSVADIAAVKRDAVNPHIFYATLAVNPTADTLKYKNSAGNTVMVKIKNADFYGAEGADFDNNGKVDFGDFTLMVVNF